MFAFINLYYPECFCTHFYLAYSEVKEEDSFLEVDQKTKSVKSEDNAVKELKENKDHQKKNAKKETPGKTQKSGTSEDSHAVSVKGLSNLGNTCFFNAVIQVRLGFISF